MGGKIELASEAGQGEYFLRHSAFESGSGRKPQSCRDRFGQCGADPFAPYSAGGGQPGESEGGGETFRKQSHRVTVAGNGKLAVELFQNGTFDLVLMDVQMPEMDGLEATRAIRKIEAKNGARIPIIAMTAQTMKGDRDNCFAAGMDGFISKPIRLPELWSALRQCSRYPARSAEYRLIVKDELLLHCPLGID